MASSLRSRFGNQEEMEGDPTADEDAGSYVDGSSDSSSDGGESDLESMTGKGIKHLCSELLELKKASDEDFQRTISSNLSAFVRIFQEVGGVESELMTLKQHILTQKNLVKDLMSSLYLEIVSDDSKDTKAEETEDLNPSSPNWFGARRYNILESLDVLLLEHRIEEALIVLEMETKALQKLQMNKEHLLPSIVSYMSAISERRTRLADQFALVADHPRVAQPELQKALSGLCSLGENNRANLLLLKFYHSHLESCMHELRCSIPFLQETYIRKLAKIIFSAISQAARSFVMLYGETFIHTSELIKWAREEIEAFSHSFDKYVKSISEIDEGLPLAVEAVNCSISYCALLKSQKIFLQPYLTKLIRPCMEEVLHIHMDHYKKLVSCCTTTDTWVLNKFLSSQILRNKSSFAGIIGEMEYCLLTSSGQKFVTLMQTIVDDITPLTILQMESSILKGLIDLFSEYMHALEEAIPNRGNDVENDPPRISSAQKLDQQLSLIVNSSTLVNLFPIIAVSIFKGAKPSKDEPFPEHMELSSQSELDVWMLSIQEAADGLRGCFCQQFVYEVMSHGEGYFKTSLEPDIDGQWIMSSAEVPMPSFTFQALFLRLKQLELFKSIFAVEDGIVENLLEELMETVIVWLSNNLEFWRRTEDCSFIPQHSCFEQVYIDMHFLMETAKLGGYFSDELMVATLDIIAQIGESFTATESDPNSALIDDEWALEAAKLAIEKLLEVEVTESEPKEEPPVSFREDSKKQESEIASLSDGEDITYSSEDYTDSVDGESAESADESIRQLLEIKSMQSEVEIGEENIKIGDSDDEGSGDGPDAIGTDTDTSTMSEIEGAEEPVGKLVAENPQDTVETETLEIEAKFPEISDELDAAVAYSSNSGGTVVLRSRDLGDFTDENASNYSTIPEELVREDWASAAEDVTTDEGFEEEQIPAERGNELVLEEGYEKQEGGNHVGGVLRPKEGREPPKHFSAAEGLGKNRKGSRAARPRWH